MNRKSTQPGNGLRESEQVQTDTSAVVEWAWELKREHSGISRTYLNK